MYQVKPQLLIYSKLRSQDPSISPQHLNRNVQQVFPSPRGLYQPTYQQQFKVSDQIKKNPIHTPPHFFALLLNRAQSQINIEQPKIKSQRILNATLTDHGPITNICRKERAKWVVGRPALNTPNKTPQGVMKQPTPHFQQTKEVVELKRSFSVSSFSVLLQDVSISPKESSIQTLTQSAMKVFSQNQVNADYFDEKQGHDKSTDQISLHCISKDERLCDYNNKENVRVNVSLKKKLREKIKINVVKHDHPLMEATIKQLKQRNLKKTIANDSSNMSNINPINQVDNDVLINCQQNDRYSNQNEQIQLRLNKILSNALQNDEGKALSFLEYKEIKGKQLD